MDHLLEFEDYLYEFVQYGLTDSNDIKKVKSILSNPKFPELYTELLDKEDITLELEEYPDGKTVELHIIEVPKDRAKEGIGSSIMNTLCEWADKNKKVITLKPAGGSRISKSKLTDWYSKFGFIMNKGENEIDGLLLMYRNPK